MEALLILRNIKVENANAIAGSTYGFPAITHFLGFAHTLSRKAQEHFDDAPSLTRTAVICHSSQTHAYRPRANSDYSFALTRQPLKKGGKTPSFSEEGRMNMEVSLLIELEDMPLWDDAELEYFTQWLIREAPSQRLAGGTITDMGKIEVKEDIKPEHTKTLKFSLLPGFALVSRPDLLAKHQQSTDQEPVEAWLSFASLTYRAHQDKDDPEKANWQMEPSPYAGWLKPIVVGYKAISKCFDPGEVEKSRDPNTPVCFVEPLYSIGQWLSPHRIQQLDELFWCYDYQPDQGHYLCHNFFSDAQSA